MLDTARTIVDEYGVADNYTITRGTMENLPEFGDDSFDIVLNLSAIECCEFPQQAIREMMRVCVPGGKILVVASNYLSPLKKRMRKLDLDATMKLLETGTYVYQDDPKPHLVHGFKADELWGYFSSAGAELVYLKGSRILDMLFSEDHIKNMAEEWGLDECINIETALSDDPALTGAGMDYCILAAKR
jgi:ubiquinone/menaquinone biosynthesis C-methylase UbiE